MVCKVDKTNDELEHFDFDEDTCPTIQLVEEINSGGEATIEHVRVQDTFQKTPFVCVRRSYKGATKRNLEAKRASQKREIGILKKLRDQHHFIQYLGSYTRNNKDPKKTEFVLLQSPRADFDLAFLLDHTPERRQLLFSDRKLERGMGCLASALYFLHETKIRHKDIAPKNILVHGNDLLITDFGLSLDFAELSNSATSNWVEQQRTYRPPEGEIGKRHTCASDVFSLGCVFLEMLNSLLAGAIHAQDNTVEVVRPYSDYLAKIYKHLETKMEAFKNQENSNQCHLFWLKKTYQMLKKSAVERPKMYEVVCSLKKEAEKDEDGSIASACDLCMENCILNLDSTARSEELSSDAEGCGDQNAHVDESSSNAVAAPSSSSPNSNSTGMLFPHLVADLVAQVLRSAGVIKRWHISFYLDNGRVLRSYGTKSTGQIVMQYDFGDLLVERVVFESGTFGKVVTLYKDKSELDKHAFRSSACDQVFAGGISVWKYMVTGDEAC